MWLIGVSKTRSSNYVCTRVLVLRPLKKLLESQQPNRLYLFLKISRQNVCKKSDFFVAKVGEVQGTVLLAGRIQMYL